MSKETSLKELQKYVNFLEGTRNTQQQKIEQLEKEVESIRIITDNSKVNQNLIEEIETLNKIIKEAINLPKGIEPHSYSDYKINKQLN